LTRKALVLAEFDTQAVPLLESLGYAVELAGWGQTHRALSEEHLQELIRDVSLLVVEVEKVTASVMGAARELELIAACRGNPSNVDVAEATLRGIPVLHAPGRNAESVADFTLGLILAIGRSICEADRHLRTNGWHVTGEIPYFYFRGPEISGKSVGLVGCGQMGRALARRLQALQMDVLAYDPYVDAEELDGLVKMVTLDDLLRDSDFVSLHVPATEETKEMIGATEIAKMKPGAFLINTARAAVVEEQALFEALQNGGLSGAALDVFWQEPLPADSQWLELDNVVLTPHIAGAAHDVKIHQSAMIIDDVQRFLNGQRPARVVNPEVFEM
jgi:phosphoglycerate dehydrogenase-like enzyme